MKMYTNSEQTAKLIELGFEKPKSEICELIEVHQKQMYGTEYSGIPREMVKLSPKGSASSTLHTIRMSN